MITKEDRFLQRGMTYKYIHIVYTASEQARHSQRLVQKRTGNQSELFMTYLHFTHDLFTLTRAGS